MVMCLENVQPQHEHVYSIKEQLVSMCYFHNVKNVMNSDYFKHANLF